MKEVNVAIIGGGITGLSTAYYLMKRGYGGIEVFDARYLGYGSTGRCAGGIRASFTSEVHVGLMREAIKGWIKWSNEIEGINFRQDGYLWLLTTDELVETHKQLMKLHNSLGVPTKLVYPEEIKEIAPPIKLNDVIAALYDPTAGKASPLDTTWALRRELIKSGVKIHEYCPVKRIVMSSGKAVGVEVDGVGTIKVSEYIVVSAGYWSKELLKPLGYDLPVKGDPHHLMITEKVAGFLKPLVIHKESGSYLVQVPTGGIIIGTEYPVPENDLDLRIGFVRKAAGKMARYFPQILHANLLRIWIGYYLKTPDHHPLIGTVPGTENVLMATGFSGHGYMMAPIVGEELANMIINGKPRLHYTEELDPGRYERGVYLEEKAIFG